MQICRGKPLACRPQQAALRAPVPYGRPGRACGPVQVQAFFNFLAPKGGAGGAVSPKARELRESLVEVLSQTKPGAAVSPVVKAEVEELVSTSSALPAAGQWRGTCRRSPRATATPTTGTGPPRDTMCVTHPAPALLTRALPRCACTRRWLSCSRCQ